MQERSTPVAPVDTGGVSLEDLMLSTYASLRKTSQCIDLPKLTRSSASTGTGERCSLGGQRGQGRSADEPLAEQPLTGALARSGIP